MIGWRARLGFLVPPGNPTVEPEMTALAPAGVSLHFHRLVARGEPGAIDGQRERTRTMIEHIDASIALLAMVKPDVIVLAHTATSYYLGRSGEADLLARLETATGRRVVTAFGSVVRALERLGVRKLALGAPYSRETTLEGKAQLEAHGFEVVRWANLDGVVNIYDETAEFMTRRPNAPIGWLVRSTAPRPRRCFSPAPECRPCRCSKRSNRISANRSFRAPRR